MKKRLLIYGIALILLGLSSCSHSQSQQETAMSSGSTEFCLNEQLKQSTTIVEVKEQEIVEQFILSGKIEYNENDLVAFRSLLGGVVEQVQFELGDYVRNGQVLATVKSSEIQDLTQQRKYYQNQIDLLEKRVKAKEDLLEAGMTAAPDLLEVEHELEGVRIELDKINQNLQLFRATGQGTFQIVAPKNGYIIQKAVSSGQSIVTDSDPLFSISNLKQVWVMVNIFASNLRYVQIGDEVRVRTIAYPDEFYRGKIDKIYNVFDDAEHVLKARVVLENQELNLMPGLSADIIIDKRSSKGRAFAIPSGAKIFSNNKEFVVVYKDDCTVKVREITPIAGNEEYVYVKEHFEPDEKIIESNALLIFEQLNQ